MDDTLKGKVFQNPQEDLNPSQPNQPQEVSPVSPPPSSISNKIPEPNESIPEQAVHSESPTPEIPIEPPLPPVQPSSPIFSQEETPTQPTEEIQVPAGTHPKSPRFSAVNIVRLLIGFFAVFLVAFIVFGLILPNLNKKEQKAELTFWDVSDGLALGSVLPDFEKQNPNIKVNYVKQDIKDYKDRLVTRVKNGTGPDLFRFHNTWVLQLSDILLPIPSDVITKDEFNKSFYPVARHDLVKNGAIYGLPVELDTLSLFVNSAMLKQASVSVPTTWNEFITASRALTLKDQSGKIKTAGAGLGAFDNVTHAPDVISMLFAQDSVNLDDISQTKPRVTDALNFYTGFAVSDGSVWDSTLDPSILAFSKGNLAMFFGYYKDQAAIKSSNPNLSFDIRRIPHLAGQYSTMASYYPIGVSIKSQHQKEALALLKFISQKETIQKLTSLPYARVDLPDRSNGAGKEAISSFFSGETFDNGLNTQVNSHLANAVNSMLAGNSADSVIDDLVLGFSQAINQFGPKQ